MPHKLVKMLLMLICNILAGLLNLRVCCHCRIASVLLNKQLFHIKLIFKCFQLFYRKICHIQLSSKNDTGAICTGSEVLLSLEVPIFMKLED